MKYNLGPSTRNGTKGRHNALTALTVKFHGTLFFRLMGFGKDPRILPATLEPGKAHVLAVVAL